MASSSVLVCGSSSDHVLPRGYVFAPTDSELLRHFLLPRTQNPDIQFEEIHDPADTIYGYVPDVLTSLYERKRSKEWYFFSRRIKKHENSSRPNRCIVGQSGYWRASSGEEKVQEYNGQLLGSKRALNYFEEKRSKSDWIMQEYTLAPQGHHPHNKFEEYALCKIYKHNSKATTTGAATNTTSTVDHQLEENNFNDVGAHQGGMECVVPQLPSDSCGDVNGGVAQAALVPTMNGVHNINITHAHQCINVEGCMINEAMVQPPLPYYSCGDVDVGDQSLTVTGAAQEAMNGVHNIDITAQYQYMNVEEAMNSIAATSSARQMLHQNINVDPTMSAIINNNICSSNNINSTTTPPVSAMPISWEVERQHMSNIEEAMAPMIVQDYCDNNNVRMIINQEYCNNNSGDVINCMTDYNLPFPINNCSSGGDEDQPSVPFMASNNTMVDVDMRVTNSGSTNTYSSGDHDQDNYVNSISDIDFDIDPEELMALIQASYKDPDLAPSAGAEVAAANMDQPSSSSVTTNVSMDADIMRDENDIYADLQHLPSCTTYHVNEWADIDALIPDFTSYSFRSQDHDTCLGT